MKARQIVMALAGTALLVAVGIQLFDQGKAHSREMPRDALLVDVRTPAEYSAGHAEGAVNIPVSELGERLGELGAKDRPIAVYCRTGNRSGYAKRYLEGQGFTRVVDLGTLQNARSARRR